MKKLHFVAVGAIATLLLAAAPALAINTKVRDVDFDHIAASGTSTDRTLAGVRRPKTRVSGKVVLDNNHNPPELPPESVGCYQDRLVEIYKILSGPDKLVGKDRTNNLGRFSKRFAHAHGDFYMELPEKDIGLDPEWYCYYEETREYGHRH